MLALCFPVPAPQTSSSLSACGAKPLWAIRFCFDFYCRFQRFGRDLSDLSGSWARRRRHHHHHHHHHHHSSLPTRLATTLLTRQPPPSLRHTTQKSWRRCQAHMEDWEGLSGWRGRGFKFFAFHRRGKVLPKLVQNA
jgi:hypothetical protein